MTSPRPGPRRVRLASLLAALALAVPLAAVQADPASAADPSTRVELTSAEVSATTLTLSGTVTNTGVDPLTQVTVSLWRSPSLLHTPEAVEGALAATTTTPGTARVVEDANRTQLVVAGDALAPGSSRSFTVSGTLTTLGLRAPDATWWAGVDTTARVGTRAARPTGSARTLVSTASEPHPIATVVELSAPPRQLKKDLFLNDDLNTEVGGGRLAALLAMVERDATSWVIDPSLLVELEDMADGYRVQTPTGSDAGTGEAAAAAWLSRLRALPRSTGAVELFGSPDLPALAGLPDRLVARAVAATTEDATLAGLTRLAVLDGPDATSLDLAGRLGGEVVLLGTEAPGVRVSSQETIAAVATGQDDAGFVPSALLPDTDLNRRAARFALARAAGGELRWVSDPADLPTGPGALPSGFRRATLPDILTLTPRAWAPPPPHSPTEGALDAGRLGRVLELRDRMTSYAAAAPASGVGGFVDAQTARAASRWWVGDTAGQDAWLAGIERRVALPEGDMVVLDAAPRFSMTGDTSEFPVTVTNRLMDPITVQVRAATDNPQRIRLDAPQPVEIAPGASNTVLLQATSAGGGVVLARVHVESPDGHRLTPDREIAVETTNYGTIGWVIVVASGLVLVVTTAHRIRQVRGQRKGEDG